MFLVTYCDGAEIKRRKRRRRENLAILNRNSKFILPKNQLLQTMKKDIP
jgi:hypothetical protein